MSATLTQAGLLRINAGFSNGNAWNQSHLVVDLYVNDYTPDQTSVPSNFTIATFGGYAQQSWSGDDDGPNQMVGSVAQIEFNGGAFLWTCTSSPQTVYGYLIRTADGVTVLAAEKFSTPQPLVIGATISLDLIGQTAQG